MARGFESKAVQDQQEEAQRSRKKPGAPPVDPAGLRTRRNLELARVDVLRRQAAAASELQRHSLALALEEIDRQLAALPVSDPFRD